MLKAYSWLDQRHSIGSDVAKTGWEKLIDRLLADINSVLSHTDAILQLLQMKEKLGTLRFYRKLVNASEFQNAEVEKLISSAVDESARTCIACGAPGVMQRRGGWIACLCEKHIDIEPI